MVKKSSISGQGELFAPETSDTAPKPANKPGYYDADELYYGSSRPSAIEMARKIHELGSEQARNRQQEASSEEQHAEIRALQPSVEEGERFIRLKLGSVLNGQEFIDELAEAEVFKKNSVPDQYGFVDGKSVEQDVTDKLTERISKKGYIGRIKRVEREDGTSHVSGRKIKQEHELLTIYQREVNKNKDKVKERKAQFENLYEQVTDFLDGLEDEYGLDEDNYASILNPPEDYDERQSEDLLSDIETQRIPADSLSREAHQQLYWLAKQKQTDEVLSQEYGNIASALEPAVKRLFRGEEFRRHATTSFEADVINRTIESDDARTQLMLIQFAHAYYESLVGFYDKQAKLLDALRLSKSEFEATKAVALTQASQASKAKKVSRRQAFPTGRNQKMQKQERGTLNDEYVKQRLEEEKRERR